MYFIIKSELKRQNTEHNYLYIKYALMNGDIKDITKYNIVIYM